MAKKYPFKEIEKKWQDYWEKNKTFKAIDFSPKPKFYVLDMFPYPSGSGLHVGHLEGYTATDIIARYKWKKGYNVLHPMGWDAFGLPAENYALQTGIHPRITTQKNIANFKRQIKAMGFAYDWDREINTTDPKYYKWTQWIFIQLYKAGLVYQDEVPVNWCPALKTVLANEEVVDGKSVRGGHPVIRKPMRQWMMKITAYAEKLLEDLDTIDFPESIKEMQRNWIGKSEGAYIIFRVEGTNETLKVFTTRPDTVFGATYMVVAPEHPLLEKIVPEDRKKEIEEYRKQAAMKSDLARTDLAKEKTGVATGAYAINPVNKKRIPIWVADYVLMTYGTGAIMAVPAHDQRDWEFAKKYGLEIIEVISGGDISKGAHEGDGILINSDFLNGLNVEKAKEKIISWLEEHNLGERAVQYKLRDWVFSRQRYWGEPFPLIFLEDGTVRLLDEDELPLKLPDIEKFEPSGTGESPLANVKEWVDFIDHKVLYDLGLVSTPEPFMKLVNQGIILGEDGEKMSKSRGNVINPDEIVENYGADTLRMYEMFMGPLEKSKPWSTSGMEGIFRFLNRVWNLYIDDKGKSREDIQDIEPDHRIKKLINKTIYKVTNDIENLKFNTAIAQFMIFVNEISKEKIKPRSVMETFLHLLNPFAPHISEELWNRMGNKEILAHLEWPEYDEEYVRDDLVVIAVQVNGKLRGQFEIDIDAPEEEYVEKALSLERVKNHIRGKPIRKKIVVKGKIVNLVV